ncbi:MAG: host attachment protein [Gammaproteobacteria bacterium]|nr:host attachment protein [Gammaproteobacteria bacterium]
MSDCCLLVADEARARIFAVRGDNVTGYCLIEMNSLANPEARLADRDLWSETQPGGTASSRSGKLHSYDDHRERQRAEHERAFAKRAASVAVQACAEENAYELLVVASKPMLGVLREALDDLCPSFLTRQDVAKNLTKLSSAEIVEHLLADGLIGKQAGRLPA